MENKPVFLSIGYSTCHWCHVMAHESFADDLVADILNENFVSIKVDKEERPDIDSIYMNVCVTLTGSGGWPTSIFMTPDQKPFFAGTYFPKKSRSGLIGFVDLLLYISKKWMEQREELIRTSDEILDSLKEEGVIEAEDSEVLIENAILSFQNNFDKNNGGFGSAPKFPAPHNLMFLMQYYNWKKDKEILNIVEKTLIQMYKGGIFDHIGFGFSRYSTDDYFLVPHFEKMLYDNALLMICYTLAYDITKNEWYRQIAEKIAIYVLRELTDPEGGFYCAQDADSDGIEGKYYVFEEDEIKHVLGDDIGTQFNDYYNITLNGNFEGKNIPNLLLQKELHNNFDTYLQQIYEYRKKRTSLHLDDKIKTSWNSLMISAFALMYRILRQDIYLKAAEKACKFMEEKLAHGTKLSVSYRGRTASGNGFLDDYAFSIYAMIHMYEATAMERYLKKAMELMEIAIKDFFHTECGGFYLYGTENEPLILRPKETYDGAMPSGNSVMTYNLIKLSAISDNTQLDKILQKQLGFMSSAASMYPMGNSFYLSALLLKIEPVQLIVCVLKDEKDRKELKFPLNANIKILTVQTEEYKLINERTTFYICDNYKCKPPSNKLEEEL